jgi:hypothetical protein
MLRLTHLKIKKSVYQKIKSCRRTDHGFVQLIRDRSWKIESNKNLVFYDVATWLLQTEKKKYALEKEKRDQKGFGVTHACQKGTTFNLPWNVIIGPRTLLTKHITTWCNHETILIQSTATISCWS